MLKRLFQCLPKVVTVFLPFFNFTPHTESAEQLSERWISEFETGIEGTKIKPGFTKTGVNPGLTIRSHTGPSLPAKQEIEILQKMKVIPKAFVWVHANGTHEEILETTKSGCWISLDGI